MANKRYACPYCGDKYDRHDLITHIDNKHEELIPENYTAARIVFNKVNNKNCGYCRVCGCETNWNEDSQRYDVLCDKPKCKETLRIRYQENMIRVRGTDNILKDPEQQKKMLANRKISGKYKFEDGGIVGYTGSYEKKALEFMDKVLNLRSKDIISPGPTLEYEYNGEKHFYITDFYLVPYNLIIEVKDGGNNPNTKDSDGMRASREKTIAKEKVITDSGEYNYLRLTNNDFAQLVSILMELKKAYLDKLDKVIIRINEAMDDSISFEGLDTPIVEDEDILKNNKKLLNKSLGQISNLTKDINITESKSTLDGNYKPKGKKDLSSFKKVHITESVINKYKKEYPFLKHVRCKDTKEYICDGHIWFDNDELVAMVGSCEYRDDRTKWVVSLEITKNYKGYGLSKQILDYAVKTMNCKYLSVNKNNKIAKKVYDDYGFKVYQEDNTMYYMTINKNIKESYFTESKSEFNELSFKNPKELSDWMKRNIGYKKYDKLMSPEDVFNAKKGSCHDQVMFEDYFFKKMGISHGKIFLIEYNEGEQEGGKTHSFIYYKDNNKFYWFENAWGGEEGIHGPYNSLNDLKDEVTEKTLKNSRYNNVEFSTVKNVETGMNLGDFVSSCLESTNIMQEKSYSLFNGGITHIEKEDISYSYSFDDVKKIVNSLSKKDLNKICNGEFKNSPYVFYREVLLINKEPVSFIDVYKLPNMEEDGVIVIATKEKWRGVGLGTILVNRMKAKLKNKNLVWKTQRNNDASIYLAKKMKFNPIFESANMDDYRDFVVSGSDDLMGTIYDSIDFGFAERIKPKATGYGNFISDFIDIDDINRRVIEVGEKYYNNIEEESFKYFVIFDAVDDESYEDLILEGIYGFDKCDIDVWQYNFENQGRRYSYLLVTHKSELLSVYLMPSNNINDWIEVPIDKVVMECKVMDCSKPNNNGRIYSAWDITEGAVFTKEDLDYFNKYIK